MPTILAALAIIGFMLPPAQVVHAHDGGRDPHFHAITLTVYAPLDGHSHPHVPAIPDEDRDDHPQDGNAPEQHVHSAPTNDVIARVRGGCVTPDGLSGTTIVSVPVDCLWSLLTVPRMDVVVYRHGREARRACSRSMDRLILNRCLLI